MTTGKELMRVYNWQGNLVVPVKVTGTINSTILGHSMESKDVDKFLGTSYNF